MIELRLGRPHVDPASRRFRMDRRSYLAGLTREFRSKCTQGESLLNSFACLLSEGNVRMHHGHCSRIGHFGLALRASARHRLMGLPCQHTLLVTDSSRESARS